MKNYKIYSQTMTYYGSEEAESPESAAHSFVLNHKHHDIDMRHAAELMNITLFCQPDDDPDTFYAVRLNVRPSNFVMCELRHNGRTVLFSCPLEG